MAPANKIGVYARKLLEGVYTLARGYVPAGCAENSIPDSLFLSLSDVVVADTFFLTLTLSIVLRFGRNEK